jgi:electron transfer flavoprotein alpha subunit
MAILVVAEHDNRELKPATYNSLRAAAQIGGDVDLLVVGSGCAAVAETAATAAGVKQGAAGRCHGVCEFPRREYCAPDRQAGARLQPCIGAGHHIREKRHAARGGASRRAADIRHQRGGISRYLHPADLCRQRHGDGSSNDSIKLLTVRTTGFEAVEPIPVARPRSKPLTRPAMPDLPPSTAPR